MISKSSFESVVNFILAFIRIFIASPASAVTKQSKKRCSKQGYTIPSFLLPQIWESLLKILSIRRTSRYLCLTHCVLLIWKFVDLL